MKQQATQTQQYMSGQRCDRILSIDSDKMRVHL